MTFEPSVITDSTGSDDLRKELTKAQNELGHLEIALHTSRRIGIAIGILMRDRLCTSEQAFDLLAKASQAKQRKLRDIAEDVIEYGTEVG